MLKLRMRTKFLLSMLLISAGLTCTSLLLVRHQRAEAGQAGNLRRPAQFRHVLSRISSGNVNLP